MSKAGADVGDAAASMNGEVVHTAHMVVYLSRLVQAARDPRQASLIEPDSGTFAFSPGPARAWPGSRFPIAPRSALLKLGCSLDQ